MMERDRILQQARKLSQKRKKLYADRRYKETIGLFVAKGFLFSNQVAPNPSAKIAVKDALWVGEQLEPRVLEVLPAAILRCPRSFIATTKLPVDLKQILHLLKNMTPEGPDFRTIPYKALMGWMELELLDKRSVKWSERKVVRSFRILPEVAKLIEKLAQQKKISLSQCLDEIVLAQSSNVT